MKNRRVETRFSNRDYQFLVSNLPQDFDNLSEFMRGAALYVARNPAILAGESSPIQLDSVIKNMGEIVIAEIQKNRSMIETLIHATRGEKNKESRRMKSMLIEDLKEFYIEHRDELRTFDDLYESVKDPFLQEVIRDTIQLMKRSGMLSFSSAGKVIWHG